MDGELLKESETNSETILGCQVQNNLKWSHHILNLRSRLKKKLAGVYNIRGVLPFGVMKTICEGWFTSVLTYCLPLFGGCNQHEIDDLQIIQNKIARLVTESSIRRNRQEIFEELGWLTVRQLIFYHSMLAAYRIKLTGEPESLGILFNNENRNSKIIIPMSNLTLYRKSFVYRGILGWNTLPENLKLPMGMGQFKANLKRWIRCEVPKF